MKRKNYDPRAAIKNSKKHLTLESAEQAQTAVENQEMAQQNNEYGNKNPHSVPLAEHPNHGGDPSLPMIDEEGKEDNNGE